MQNNSQDSKTPTASYVNELLTNERTELKDLEKQLTRSIKKEEVLARDINKEFDSSRSPLDQLSDNIATFAGSWAFVVSFVVGIIVWMSVNVYVFLNKSFDPYPFILLNLILSCVAALQAPVILMSQRRMETRDRLRAEHDYSVNLKAELEIRHLHEKIDFLLTKQWQRLLEIQEVQVKMIDELMKNTKAAK